MAAGLSAAAAQLSGEVLVFWDCYRPHDVQVKMFDAYPDPAFVALPGPFARSHEAGRSVDVSLASKQRDCDSYRRVGEFCLAELGTPYDDFTAQAGAYTTTGLSELALANRARLRTAMEQGGLAPYEAEWWHFDGPEADVERPILDVPVN